MSVDPEKQRGPEPESFASLSRMAEMGWELGAGIIGLTLAGLWIDWRFGCGPTATIIGAAIGIVGGLYNFLRRAMRMRPPVGRGGTPPGSHDPAASAPGATAPPVDESAPDTKEQPPDASPRLNEAPAEFEIPESEPDDERR